MALQPDDVRADDVVQISMTGTTFIGVVHFLRSRGLTIDAFPVGDGELPTFTVGISDELWNRVRQDRKEDA